MLMGRTADGAAQDAEGVTLALTAESAGRETIRARAVIGADGIGSRLRAALGAKDSAVFRGYVAWRATIPRDRAPPALAVNETGLWLGPRGHVVHYPVAGGRSLNVVAIQRTPEPVEGWAAPGAGPDLTAHYSTASPLLLDLLEGIDHWLLWSLSDRPVTRIVEGRLALMGDAAHPILPFLAQGAALAIEDADALAASLREAPDIPAAFRSYEAIRLRRVRRVQAQARRNGRIYHMGGLMSLARDAVMARIGPQGMAERYAWLYGH
jgi:salicylate hydroxylase